ncbi:MAG: HAMP domain-containing histidine kinase [Clostridia bacterium]|nr:HAMP domain-containing histidine kinase [Clostridia bacterium]
MAFLRSGWMHVLAFLLCAVLLFSSAWCYVYANDNAGMSEIFTYTDFRNTKNYHQRLAAASEEMVSLARQVYSGRKVSSVDLEGGAIDGVFHYYFYADGTTLTDIPLLEGVDFSHAKTLAVYRNGICYLMDTNHTQTDSFSHWQEYSWDPYDLTKTVSLTVFSCDAGAILVPDSDWINEQYSLWATAKNRALMFIILLALAALPMIYLILAVSWGEIRKKPENAPRFFTEFILLAGVLAVMWILQILDISFFRWFQNLFSLFNFGANPSVYFAYSLLFTFLVLLLLLSVVSLIRFAKENRLVRGSFLWWFCNRPFLALRRRADKQYFRRYRYSFSFLVRTVVFLLLEAVLIGFYVATAVNRYWIVLQIILLFGAVSLVVVYLFGIYSDLRSLNRLLDHITELQNGNLSHRAEIPDGNIFFEYEDQLRSVGDGFDSTLRSQISAERSRVNLITNVSHDLRTPLTSIIGYLDLLSKVELSDEARDYVKILTQKSNRLNHLVSDVFALSKANSGAEDVPVEDLDLFLLARQLVADLSDSAAAAGKTVRLSGQGSAPICSNGNKIYRILQNMLDNALKYSLTGTRIFVLLSLKGETATVTVKNTSSYEMNFSAEEISEQFVRGDPSRTGEGSGLGLAIAKSFAEQLNAKFSITIDGDQFSTSVTFPLKKEITPENED